MKLYPKISPYKKGFLKVSKIHSIYYELVGNPKGIPLIVVHGGPGTGCSPKLRSFFNPKKFNGILFDQRGSKRSTPYLELRENNTWELVEDMVKLLDHVGVKKVFIIGGSWGSTLSLCFAIKYPERVKAMLLWGIFLPGEEDIDHFLRGGVGRFFPEVWERFVSIVPKKFKKNPMPYYLKKMKSKNKKVLQKYAKEWARFEIKLIKMEMSDKEVSKALKDSSFESFGLFEAHYLTKNCFMPKDFILNNTKKIKNIPLGIVHGRFDMICIPKMAHQLHKKIPKSKIWFETGGHSSREPAMLERILKEIKRYSKNPNKWPR